MIRLFAALSIPGEVGPGLALLQHGLPGARWRPAESFHITLRFMGEIAETLADDLDAEAGRHRLRKPFDLRLLGVGGFADGPAMRTVWAGVEESASLRRLAARCESAARRAGLKAERRRFRPHVTLAYLNGADAPGVARWIQANNLWASQPFRAAAFGLYSSRRGRAGSTYRLERAYALSAGAVTGGEHDDR